MRFVTSSLTGTGLVVCERRAAAAAALERFASEAWFRTKAFVAASDAEALGGADLWGGLEAALLRLENMAAEEEEVVVVAD